MRFSDSQKLLLSSSTAAWATEPELGERQLKSRAHLSLMWFNLEVLQTQQRWMSLFGFRIFFIHIYINIHLYIYTHISMFFFSLPPQLTPSLPHPPHPPPSLPASLPPYPPPSPSLSPSSRLYLSISGQGVYDQPTATDHPWASRRVLLHRKEPRHQSGEEPQALAREIYVAADSPLSTSVIKIVFPEPGLRAKNTCWPALWCESSTVCTIMKT